MASIYFLALLVGILAGLRALMAPALVAWAAYLGWLDLDGSWLAFFGKTWVTWLLTFLAAGELITDQLPATPSRTVPMQLTVRLITGSLSGAAIGASSDMTIGGLIAGFVGASIGTFAGHAFRTRLATRLKNDHPAALIEDAIAIGGAILIGAALP